MAETNKKSFILYNDNYSAIRNLSTEDKATLLDVIFKYNIGEHLPEMNYTIQAVFSFFKNSFDRDIEKYNNACERNRANIKKRYATKPTSGKSGIPNLPLATKSTTGSDSDSDMENVNVNVTLKEIKESFSKFYYAYPKHISRGQAETTFSKVLKKQKIKTIDELNIFRELLINAINLQITEHKNKNPGDDYKFWQNPSTWLNAGGWLNEVDLRIPNQQQHPKNESDRNSNYISMLKDAEQRLLNQQKIGENK